MAQHHIPPQPALPSALYPVVFVHRSQRALAGDPFGGAARLAALGRGMLQAAYAEGIWLMRRNLSRAALQEYINENYPQFIFRWVSAYGWRTRMRAVPPGTDLNSYEETLAIFETIAGAVVAQDEPELGQQGLFHWVKKLVSVP